MTNIVIGSGPSGISTAVALLARGETVTILDAGNRLEPKLEEKRNAMAAQEPGQWGTAEISAYQEPQFHTPDGQARRFGSDFAMEPPAATLDSSADWFGLRASRALGGLSNLWGTAVLPYRQGDIENWPVTIETMAPHYNAVAEFMPVAGRTDDLNTIFPGFQQEHDTAIPPGIQARELLKRLGDNPTDGIHFGAARNAVSTECNACGMCLHGCPWGHMYSSGHTLAQLRSHPSFTYHSGKVTTAFEETADGVNVHLTNGQTVTGTRLFIGAGVLETARIILNSSPERDQTLTLLDSQQTLVPLLHRWRTERVDRMPLTTLPQVFIEMDQPAISAHLVHSQIYTWNDHYARDLIANYGFGLPPVRPFLRALARRLIVAQMFLHSDHSHRIRLSLNSAGKLSPELLENPDTSAVLKSAQHQLGRSLSKSGLNMLGFASRPGNPGSSFHVGGTLPMSKSPKSGQSDTLGRPHGLGRVHLVDSSVFPSIPATTITFSIMANAHRIASLAP